MNELIEKVDKWAEDRNLISGSDSKSQTLKLISEVGELSDNVNKKRDIRDDIGDCIVVLNILARQNDLSLSECLQVAYDDIKDRKGKMVDGVFIKEGDIEENSIPVRKAVMRISDEGTDHLIKIEGVKKYQYLDSAGFPTIGVGHLLTKDEISSGKIHIGKDIVHYRNGLSDDQVEKLLIQDLKRFMAAVNENVSVHITQSQFDALVSFSFNIGVDAFLKSTLLRKLNNSDYEEVPRQMRRWNKSAGKILTGLKIRREKEIALWLSEMSEQIA